MLLMMMNYVVVDDGDDNHDDDHDDDDDDDVHDPGSADGTVRLWDLRKLASTKMLEGMRSSSFSLSFTATDVYHQVDACSDGAADFCIFGFDDRDHQSSLTPP